MFFRIRKDAPAAPRTKETIEALWRLEKIILDTLDFNDVVQKIVDSVLVELGSLKLGYRIVVLTLIDEKTQTLKRVSISQTDKTLKAIDLTPAQFSQMDVPLTDANNVCIKSIRERVPFITHDWADILYPSYTAEDARRAQQLAGIRTSMIYPVITREKAVGALVFNMEKGDTEVSDAERDLIRNFTDVVGLAVQNSQLFSSVSTITEQLKNANEKLKEIDLLKDEFVSLASHELRTPMTVIKSYIWLLLEGRAGELTDKQKMYLNRTYSSTNRLIGMVSDMLNISRIESGRLTIDIQPTDLPSLVSEIVNELQPKAQELGLQLVFNPPQYALPLVSADPERIKQVLINLIGNSLKFTPRDGNITVNIEHKDGFVETHVTDTGQGIKPDDMGKLFQKFNVLGEMYLTKQAGQGTGLGLYLSKSLVELHKGKIWVNSDGEGKGSTFTFSLPVAN